MSGTSFGKEMAHAKDQVSIADGQITLYRRDDVRDALWQCRIKMKGHRGYIRRSTGQKELEKAEQAAWQILGVGFHAELSRFFHREVSHL